MADDRPSLKPESEYPPILDYPTPPQPDEIDTEPWPQVLRAMLIVFGILGAGSIIFFGFCGVLVRGC